MSKHEGGLEMCWQIRDILFFSQQQTLFRGDKKVALEPLVAEVLDYFCHHPDTLISREQLIEDIWKGQAVTDNAVSRVIANLRKCLGDQPREPRFIATFPKKGYKFIAPVQKVAPQESGGIPKPQPKAPKNLLLWVLPLVGLAGLGIGWLLSIRTEKPRANPKSIQALTRDGGDETMPAMAPDGKTLAYSEMIDGRMHLFLKDLATDERVEIGQENGWNGPAAWSDDGTELVYLNTTENHSQYFLLELKGLTLGRSRLIHQSPVGSAGKMIFTHTPGHFIFAEREKDTDPYILFLLDLNSHIQQKLPQPDLVLGGNSQLDLHPLRDELLISSPNANHWLDFYRLKLDDLTLHHLFELQEFTCCAIWDHSGRSIVIKGSHPAQTLMRFALSGKPEKELIRVPQRISTPGRFPNGEDYIFSGGMLNHDIYQVSLEGTDRKTLVNASVDDRLTALSPDGIQLAFISERSGTDEVWLLNRAGLSTRKLTRFGDGRHYFDLQWSPDGQFLAGVTINEVHLIDTQLGRSQPLALHSPQIRGISWKDSETLALSLKVKNKWRLHFYSIPNHQITMDSERWAFARFAQNPSDWVWIDQNGTLFTGPGYLPLNLTLDQPLYGARFNLAKKDLYIYYLRYGIKGFQMWKYDIPSTRSSVLFDIEYPLGFEVDESGIYFSDLEAYSRDIFRTTPAP